MSLTVNLSASNLANDSIVIPLVDLEAYGLLKSQWTADSVGLEKAIFSLLKGIQSHPFFGVLGLSKPSKPVQVSSQENCINTVFSLTAITVANLTDRSMGLIALPTTGTNAGIGGLGVADIFPNAMLKSARQSVDSALIIPVSDLVPYGLLPSEFPASGKFAPGEDMRSFFVSLYQYLVISPEIADRANGQISAIIKRFAERPAIASLPSPNPQNPITGINPDHVVIAIAQTFGLTFQQEIDWKTNSIDLKFV